ncbi:MAG TPA: alpha/beta hydrolase [Alphaproteobacteria bacterium]|nr:alpha/beta hydrolase [Alphaproteobacteria bacterium]
MDRRDFLHGATMTAAGGAAALIAEGAAPARAQAQVPAGAATAMAGEPRMRRYDEQRWVLDNVIRSVGLDWDQPRTIYWNAPIGFEGLADFAAIRQRVQKYADITPAFEATARRREAKAVEAEKEGDTVTARENYYMATIHWGAAQWPIDENSEKNILCNTKKRECFGKYAALADHKIEAVWIPFQGKQLPGWLHLPYGYSGGRVPAVVAIPGMDSFKEGGVALYGDRWLNRGLAVLAIEGPGQYECPVLGIYMSVPAWAEAAKAFYEFAAARPEIDPQRIGVVGTSFGSFAGTISAGAEPRYKACAVSGTALEPGWNTVFNEASPTFKKRFMYMANIQDEAKFDAFAKSLTWEGYAEKIRMPYLCIGGEADELSPIENAERCVKAIPGPKRLVIYQDSRHSVGGVPAAALGPSPTGLQADFMAAALSGKTFPSERWFVDATGRITKTAI